MTSHYDLAGQRTKLVHTDGKAVNYQYDLLGRVGIISEDYAGGNDHLIIRYWYDDRGRRTSVVRGAGLGGTGTSHYYVPHPASTRRSSMRRGVRATSASATTIITPGRSSAGR